MTEEKRPTRPQLSTVGAFHIGQGLCFITGGILAVVSVWKSALLGEIPTAELGLAAFALGVVSNGGAAYFAGRIRRAGLSLLAAAAFVVLTIEPYSMEIAGSIVLLLIGILLLVDSIAENGLDERLPG